MAMRKVLLIACGLMAVSLVNGCISMPDLASTNLEIRNAVDTLNRGIDVLAKESADWRLVIRDILDELPEEAQGTLRAEVTDLLERGIAATGSEFRCDMDFLRLRVREDLERIRHKHFGGPEPTPRRPYLCMAVPLIVDMNLDAWRRNRLEFYGFDLDTMPISAFVEDKDTNMTNVTRFLNIVTHYHMTLNLGGEAVGLNDDHRKILLFWDNSLQSAVSVIPAEYEEECTTQVKFVTPGTRTYTPPHTNIPGYNKGNRDFSGHGPKIDAEVTLKLGANRRGILATISMVAWEWNVSKNRPRSDYTAAAGETTEVIYLAPDGWRIRSYDVLNSARVSYIDSNHRDDIFPAGGMLPVEKWTFVGDTGGSEAGDKTKVQVKLSNFNVVIESCP
jgi:hypothetical protein